MPTCECGAELSGPAGELCPACLLRLGLEFNAEEGDARPCELPHLVAPIGRGALGTTCLGIQEDRLPAFVAVKLIEVAVDVEQFVSAVRTVADQFAHQPVPGVAAPLGCGATDDGRAFVLFPYFQGMNLQAHARHPAVDADSAIAVAKGICSVVAALHQRQLAHGALKPGNVLIPPGRRPAVVLLDVGVATAVSQARPVSVPQDADHSTSAAELCATDVRALHTLVDLCLLRAGHARRRLSAHRCDTAAELALELSALRL